MRINKILFIAIFILLGGGCLTIKPGSIKSGHKFFESFFVGEEGTQYFIKPLTFENNLQEEFKLDITFRYKNEIKDSAILNFSILSDEIFKNMDSLVVNNTDFTIAVYDIKLLFNEMNNKKILSRFSSKASPDILNNLFKNNDWLITYYIQGNNGNYTPPKKTKKHIDKIWETLFVLF